MKKIPGNALVLLLVRVFLSTIFIIAAIDKIADPNAFAASISNYKIVDGSTAMLAATLLPWLELLCGLGLLLGIAFRGSSLLATLMLAGFTLLVASAVLRGLDITCGCFTQDPAAQKIGWLKVGEDAGMFLLSLIPFFSRRAISPASWFRGKATA